MTNNYIRYEERKIEVQIKIDQLLRFYKYPKSFYEKKTDREIYAIHKSKLGEMAALSIASYTGKKIERQLQLF